MRNMTSKTKVLPISLLTTLQNKDSSNGTNLSANVKVDVPEFLPSLEELNLPDEIQSRLYEHQVLGVRWLYGIHTSQQGGILGDDMGLGKTFQVTALLTGLMRSKMMKKALIIAPVSVLQNWQRELQTHLLPYVKRASVEVLSAELTKKKRTSMISNCFASSHPSVIVSSYQLIVNMMEELSEQPFWDYVILDEGHVIKNPATKMFKSFLGFQSHHRLLLTGTPIQNNLTEFWSLVHWSTHGAVLGTRQQFTKAFVEPIEAGQDPKASAMQRAVAERAAVELMKMIRPILLQRKKCEHAEMLELPEKTELVVWIPLSSQQRKLYQDYLTGRSLQDALTRSDIPLEAINHLKTLCRHPLLIEASAAVAKNKATNKSNKSSSSFSIEDDLLTSMKSLSIGKSSSSGKKTSVLREKNEKLSSLPLGTANYDNNSNVPLMKSYKKKAAVQDQEEEAEETEEVEDENSSHMQRKLTRKEDDDRNNIQTEEDMINLPANANLFEILQRTEEVTAYEIMQGSVKLRVLLKLIRRLLRQKHRILIFSQSKLMLDIIERVLSEYSLETVRIDGSVTGKVRQQIIDEFNNNDHHQQDQDDSENEDENSGGGASICLLTTRACGYGITLTGADRVIIFDPSWNPAEDRQAVDRAYRIGQLKDMVVYRFIMAGSVEEKMYEKQVFKDGVRVVTESGSSSRYFSRHESKELFSLGPPNQSDVMEQLWKLAGSELREVDDTRGILPYMLGFTRHDTLYKEVRDETVRQLHSANNTITSKNSHSNMSSTSKAIEKIKNQVVMSCPVKPAVKQASSSIKQHFDKSSYRDPVVVLDDSSDEEMVFEKRAATVVSPAADKPTIASQVSETKLAQEDDEDTETCFAGQEKFNKKVIICSDDEEEDDVSGEPTTLIQTQVGTAASASPLEDQVAEPQQAITTDDIDDGDSDPDEDFAVSNSASQRFSKKMIICSDDEGDDDVAVAVSEGLQRPSAALVDSKNNDDSIILDEKYSQEDPEGIIVPLSQLVADQNISFNPVNFTVILSDDDDSGDDQEESTEDVSVTVAESKRYSMSGPPVLESIDSVNSDLAEAIMDKNACISNTIENHEEFPDVPVDEKINNEIDAIERSFACFTVDLDDDDENEEEDGTNDDEQRNNSKNDLDEADHVSVDGSSNNEILSEDGELRSESETDHCEGVAESIDTKDDCPDIDALVPSHDDENTDTDADAAEALHSTNSNSGELVVVEPAENIEDISEDASIVGDGSMDKAICEVSAADRHDVDAADDDTVGKEQSSTCFTVALSDDEEEEEEDEDDVSKENETNENDHLLAVDSSNLQSNEAIDNDAEEFVSINGSSNNEILSEDGELRSESETDHCEGVAESIDTKDDCPDTDALVPSHDDENTDTDADAAEALHSTGSNSGELVVVEPAENIENISEDASIVGDGSMDKAICEVSAADRHDVDAADDDTVGKEQSFACFTVALSDDEEEEEDVSKENETNENDLLAVDSSNLQTKEAIDNDAEELSNETVLDDSNYDVNGELVHETLTDCYFDFDEPLSEEDNHNNCELDLSFLSPVKVHIVNDASAALRSPVDCGDGDNFAGRMGNVSVRKRGGRR